jgi:dihydroflavonol-4-reductase
MKTLVTGGTGFIGSRVVRLLVEHGYHVRCLVRSERRAHRLAGLPVEQVRGDVLNSASLAGAGEGCDACVHLAGVSGWDQITREHVHETIFGGTVRLFEAMQEQGVGRFVYVSSIAAIDGTDRPTLLDEASRFSLAGSGLTYAVAKHQAERAVLARSGSGTDAIIVNPAETYGAEDEDWITAGTIRDVLRGWPALSIYGGSSIVHVDDVAQGIVGALQRGRPGERYILGGDNLTIGEIVRLTLELASLRRPVVRIPFPLLRLVAAACGAVGARPPVEPGLLGYLRRYWFVDSSKAQVQLDYRPRPAREALAPAVHWVQAQLSTMRGSREADPRSLRGAVPADGVQ